MILVALVTAWVVLLGGMGLPARTILAADSTITPGSRLQPRPIPDLIRLGTTVRFFGRGYGHGVGMSQYGARGRALAGQTAATILAHYYRGTTLGSIATGTPIRVRVLSGWTATPAAPLLVYGRLAAWTVDGITGSFPVDAALRLIPTTTSTSTGPRTTWRLRITGPNGAVLHDAPKPASVVVRGGTAGQLQLWSKPSSYDRFRGTLRIIASASAPTVSVADELPLETYLRGVVPVEMPSSWPTQALRAQAIASRSYAARRLRPGVSYYDVTDDTSSQVYHGALGEKATTNALITATAGVVLRAPSGAIANTLFHSTGGGATENNENVYVSSTGAIVAGAVSYLRGSSDRAPDGSAYDAASPYATWATRTYTVAQLSAWFAADPRTNVGTLATLDLRDRGVSGRLIKVTLIGSTGTKTVSGDVFRSVFNAHRPPADPMMRSTLVATAPIP